MTKPTGQQAVIEKATRVVAGILRRPRRMKRRIGQAYRIVQALDDAGLLGGIDTILRLRAERDKLRQHSVQLNRLYWTISKALGDVSEDDTETMVDPDRLVNRMIERLNELERFQGVPLTHERLERAAALVHQAYLDTCARLGWPVKPENTVPYDQLSEDSKELNRASVRAVWGCVNQHTGDGYEKTEDAANNDKKIALLRAALVDIRHRHRWHGGRCRACREACSKANVCDDPECRAEGEQHPCWHRRVIDAALEGIDVGDAADPDRGQAQESDLCMTGDGNPAVDMLCRECLDRPYGTERPSERTDLCAECFEPVEVWYGNQWGPKHVLPGWSYCRHKCHDGEIIKGDEELV